MILSCNGCGQRFGDHFAFSEWLGGRSDWTPSALQESAICETCACAERYLTTREGVVCLSSTTNLHGRSEAPEQE